MQNAQSINYFEIVQCIANILTCLGVLLAAFEFIKSYRYKIKIKYDVGSVGSLKSDESVKVNYGFIINNINRSVFDISITSVSIRLGKKDALSIGGFGELSSYTIEARNSRQSCIYINDGIINNVIKKHNVDLSNRIYIIVETPIKTYTKRTSFKVSEIIEKYNCYKEESKENNINNN